MLSPHDCLINEETRTPKGCFRENKEMLILNRAYNDTKESFIYFKSFKHFANLIILPQLNRIYVCVIDKIKTRLGKLYSVVQKM